MTNSPLVNTDPSGLYEDGPSGGFGVIFRPPKKKQPEQPVDISLILWLLQTPVLQTREQIARVAKSKVGSLDYLVANEKGIYKAGKDKCNELVADSIEESGAKRPQVHYTNNGTLKGWFQSFFTRDPDANEWANPSIAIPGWSAPMQVSAAQPGDVIAQAHGKWGHSGIVAAPGQTVSVNTAAKPEGIVTVNDWGFRPRGGHGEAPNDPPPVVRRCVVGGVR